VSFAPNKWDVCAIFRRLNPNPLNRLQAYRKQRNKEDADDLHFPDEKDTPRHGLAQTRFQRYRGLKSFRTSPWDSYEDLPLDYAKIFQFEDYERTRRRAEEAGREEGVEVRGLPS
jgi:pre-rRNA-processing protein TSR1